MLERIELANLNPATASTPSQTEIVKQENITKLQTQLQQRVQATLTSNQYPADSLEYRLLSILATHPSQNAEDEKALDLYFTMNSIYRIILNNRNEKSFIAALNQFFSLRESILHTDMQDYCATLSDATYLCGRVLDILYPNTPPLNHLLKDALTQDRSEPWRDHITRSVELPDRPGDFIRDENNRIHLYSGILEQAIFQLKSSCTQLEEILKPIDRKPGDKNAFSPAMVHLLKQRSATFNILIEYIERLSKRTKEKQTVEARFTLLRAALLAGDTEHDGNEYNAGSAANIEIADFGDWWNNLSQTPSGKSLQERICAIHQNNLGVVINIILDTNTSNRNDPTYCIQIKGSMLEGVLKTDEAKAAFAEIDRNIDWKVTDAVLDEWAEAIEEEIANSTPSLTSSQNIFRVLASEEKFIHNCLQDEGVDYDTLFVHANESILWYTREQDDGRTSSLYYTLKKKKNEDFIKFLLAYHSHHYSQNALSNILKILYHRNHLECMAIVLKKSPHAFDDIREELFNLELSKSPVNFNVLKILYQSPTSTQCLQLLNHLNNTMEDDNSNVALMIAHLIELRENEPENIEFLINILQVSTTLTKYDVLQVITNRFPYLIQHPFIQTLFETFVTFDIFRFPLDKIPSLLQTFRRNDYIANEKVFPGLDFIIFMTRMLPPESQHLVYNTLPQLSDETASQLFLEACSQHKFSLAHKLLTQKANIQLDLERRFTNQTVTQIICKHDANLGSMYDSLINQILNKDIVLYRIIKSYELTTNVMTAIHYAFMDDKPDRSLLDALISHPKFPAVLSKHPELCYIPIDTKDLISFKAIISHYFDLLPLSVLLKAVGRLIKKKEDALAIGLVNQIKTKFTSIEEDENFCYLLTEQFSSFREYHLEILCALTNAKSLTQLFKNTSLDDIKKENRHYYKYIFEHHVNLIPDENLLQVVPWLLQNKAYGALSNLLSQHPNLYDDHITEAATLLKEMLHLLPQQFINELREYLPYPAISALFTNLYASPFYENLRIIELFGDYLKLDDLLEVLDYLDNMAVLSYADSLLRISKVDFSELLLKLKTQGSSELLINKVLAKIPSPTISDIVMEAAPIADTAGNNNRADLVAKLDAFAHSHRNDDKLFVDLNKLDELQQQQISMLKEIEKIKVQSANMRFFSDPSLYQNVRTLPYIAKEWSRTLTALVNHTAATSAIADDISIEHLQKLVALSHTHDQFMNTIAMLANRYGIDSDLEPPRKLHCLGPSILNN